MPFQIAIDGPVAAGKGTVSKLIAKRLNFLYVDTGAMYRVAAYVSKSANISLDNAIEVADIVANTKIDMHNPTPAESDGRLTTVLVNDVDVSWAIRTEDISLGSSKVATYPEVRSILVNKQQEIAKTSNVVMEGRDITYRVLPDADLKIYLTGSDEVRARRRHLDLINRGQDVDFETVLKDLKDRDYQDSHRSVDPLQIVPEAWVIDTTNLSIEEVVDMIESKVKIINKS